MAEILDLRERQEALDPSRSFIVEAPAGSGKTTLLIQRYLRLLSTVQAPEEVLAVTFTIKAAGEMHARVVEALEKAAADRAALNENEALTLGLAELVLAEDKKYGWNLLENPGRLRIRTIDSFCASLTRRTPLLSRLGMGAAVTDAPERLYEEAARRTLSKVDDEGEGGEAIRQLLRYNDNSLSDLERKLVLMLKKRDQWLRHIGGVSVEDKALRESLEGALVPIVEEGLREAAESFPPALWDSFAVSARYAAANIAEDNPIALLADLMEMPTASSDNLGLWKALSGLLVTKGGAWRSGRGVNSSIGFPANKDTRCAEAKEGFKDLLKELEGEDRLLRSLVELRDLPEPHYDDEDWKTLLALLHLLPLAVAHLRKVFAREGALDFPAVSMAAIRALGPEESPTDLMLLLDNTFRHILVDEYQDTSWTQLSLLQALTCGWEPGDGRTLFIVGDPMQSIYNFRDTDVGLFLRGRSEGVGVVRLEHLRLQTNFRSEGHIVNWVNETFGAGGVFPADEDVTTGAVPYSEALAVKGPGEEARVNISLYRGRSDAEEASEIMKIIKNRAGHETMAILYRSRAHVEVIVERLQDEGIDFLAVDLVPLGLRPVINDLLALQGALLHPAERVAWLSLLRARWCGLTLSDIYIICAGDRDSPVWELIHDEERISRLSEEGARRLLLFREIMGHAMTRRGRLSSRRLLEGLWTALGGQALYEDDDSMAEAERFFEIVESLDEAGILRSTEELRRRVEGLYATRSADTDNPLQIMSIHGAKGLEFDHVILPGLGRPPRSGEREILYWMEHGADLLLAPMGKKGAESESLIYKYLRGVRRERETLERSRIFYVAATRAAKELYLFGHIKGDAEDMRVDSRSFLGLISHVLSEDMVRCKGADTAPAEGSVSPGLHLKRLSRQWKLPGPDETATMPAAGNDGSIIEERATERPVFDWAGAEARHSGTVAHRYFYRVVTEGLSEWGPERVMKEEARMEAMLRGLGLNRESAREGAKQSVKIITNAINDERGQWVLKNHSQGAVEYALTGMIEGRIRRAVIDRTFVDEDGVRWIIDYKTGQHRGGDIKGFLNAEKERYRGQLEEYAGLLGALHEGEEIRKALYYPAIPAWIEW
ncbi:MAG: UvrD-helicase domain-containing protein [Thermodesulfobacteriota bacterium]